MTEYDGPGRLVWCHLLTKTRFPQPDFTSLCLDRSHKYVATISLRNIYIVELDNAAKGRRVIQAHKTLLPNVRAFAGCAWCRNEDTPELLAAVLGTDVIIYDVLTLKPVAHLQAPCGKSLHPPPVIDWGGSPSVFVTGGSDGAQKVLKIWTVDAETREEDGAGRQLTFKEATGASLPNVPQAFAIHATRPQLAVQAGPTIQVWSTKTMTLIFEKRFLTPVRSIAWSATRHSHLLLLYHREAGGRDSRFIGPVLADIDLTDQSCTEEPSNVGTPHPLHNIASVRLHALPLPFAPMLLVCTYSSQWSEGTYIRPSENPVPDGDTWGNSYQAQTSIVPSKGVRAIAVRRVDGEQDRSLQLVILYTSGLLILRAFMAKPMDLMLDTQIRLLQERKDVELVKLSSGATSLESIKLRVKVPQEQVPFLEQTHHDTKSPVVVFFEVTVKTGDQEPELVLSNACLRNDHELSLDDRLLDTIGTGMRQAILKAARENLPWLPSMLDACNAQIQSMGMFQPSQLRKFQPSVLPNTPPRLLKSASGPSIESSFGDCPFLPVQSPQVCYHRAYVVQPRYSGMVFAPTGQLVFYGLSPGTPDVHVLDCPILDRDRCREWILSDRSGKSCAANATATDDPHVKGAWTLLPHLLRNSEQNPALRQVLEALLRSALTSKRYLLFGAMAGVCVMASRAPEGGALLLPRSMLVEACTCIRAVMTSALAQGYHTLEREAAGALFTLLRARGATLPPARVFTLEFEPVGGIGAHGDIPRAPPYGRVTSVQAAETARRIPSNADTIDTAAAGAKAPATDTTPPPAPCAPHNGSARVDTSDPPAEAATVLTMCSVCASVVAGLAAACVRCRHVSHLKCQTRWFAEATQCPTGCGCECVFTL